MSEPQAIFKKIDFQNRIVRGIAALALVGILSFLLWQAGVLLRDPNEEVELTGAGGETIIVDIRAADASVETPNPNSLGVGVKEGELAPNFEVSTLTGERVQLSDFRGQAVFLNFWASWCGPCRAEMPDIEAVLRKHEADGLVVLAMNNGEPFGPARNFIEDLGVSLTAVGLDPSQNVIGRYRVVAMPTSIFIDSEGVITRIHAGLATEDQIDQFVQEALGFQAVSP